MSVSKEPLHVCGWGMLLPVWGTCEAGLEVWMKWVMALEGRFTALWKQSFWSEISNPDVSPFVPWESEWKEFKVFLILPFLHPCLFQGW